MIKKSDKIHHAHCHGVAVADVMGHTNARKIRRAVGIGCIVNAVLMVLKMVTGHYGHSDALVADGFHSLNDFAADLIMLMFVGISFRGPDSRYSYGYGKFETFSTFLMSSFLIIVSLIIGYEGIESLVGYSRGMELEQPDIWTVIVVLFAMAAKEGLYHFYSSAGKKAGSKALVANAWHHRSDALSSMATLVGIAGAMFLGDQWRILDPIAAMVVSVFIVVVAVKIGRPAVAELLERSLPADVVEGMYRVIGSTPGVRAFHRFASRHNGNRMIVDFHIKVDPDISVVGGHHIASEVEHRLKEHYGQAVTATIHVEPYMGQTVDENNMCS